MCKKGGGGDEWELGMMGKRIGGFCHLKGFWGNRCQEGLRSKGKRMMPR